MAALDFSFSRNDFARSVIDQNHPARTDGSNAATGLPGTASRQYPLQIQLMQEHRNRAGWETSASVDVEGRKEIGDFHLAVSGASEP
jgi:hypothetical protein